MQVHGEGYAGALRLLRALQGGCTFCFISSYILYLFSYSFAMNLVYIPSMFVSLDSWAVGLSGCCQNVNTFCEIMPAGRNILDCTLLLICTYKMHQDELHVHVET